MLALDVSSVVIITDIIFSTLIIRSKNLYDEPSVDILLSLKTVDRRD